MKIVCAGFPKTGSKSASAALRKLGYNVADFLETMQYFSHIWDDYMEGRCDIEAVIQEYERRGFDTNQDVPGNLYWEQLYDALGPDTKVILTIRDNEEVWFNSLHDFVSRSFAKFGFLSTIGTWAAYLGAFGPEIRDVTRVSMASFRILFGLNIKFEHDELSRRFRTSKEIMKQKYRAHVEYVKTVVPKENLLIWNVKQGWSPLCKFLDKEEPNCPVPRENMKAELIEKYRETDFIQGVIKSTMINLGLFMLIIATLAVVLLSPSLVEPINIDLVQPLWSKFDQLFTTFTV